MKLSIATDCLSAIAHEGRLVLVRRLIQAGPTGVSAGRLADFAGIGPTTASAQLLVLANAGLVKGIRRGRQVTYVADYERMRSLLTFLMLDCCCGEAEICEPVAKACCP